MTIAIDFVGTNLGSGTKTYNINFCNQLSKVELTENIKIFICKSYLNHITIEINQNNRIEYIIKSNLLSITLLRLLWMQFILPFELKLQGVKKIYSPMNFSPILAKFLNIKIVLCLHSNLPWVYFNLMPGNRLRNFFTKKLMELSIYTSDHLLVDSYFAKEEISKILNLYKKKIEVIYLNINNKFLSENFKKKSIKNFNYEDKYILSVMSCVRYHNIINLLKAFKLLIKEINYNIKLVLVLQILDKKYFLEVKKHIEDNFVEDKIFIYSNLDSDELPSLYKFSQLYVFTSYCEVFGLTSLEAMSQGIPVVISNRSALPEINGNAALYFDPDDVDEIKNSLNKVMLDKNLRAELIQNGKEQLNKFNSEKNIKKTIDIIQNLKL
jgi:glycosyltransferase involved in cell wall biosynthesis